MYRIENQNSKMSIKNDERIIKAFLGSSLFMKNVFIGDVSSNNPSHIQEASFFSMAQAVNALVIENIANTVIITALHIKPCFFFEVDQLCSKNFEENTSGEGRSNLEFMVYIL